MEFTKISFELILAYKLIESLQHLLELYEWLLFKILSEPHTITDISHWHFLNFFDSINFAIKVSLMTINVLLISCPFYFFPIIYRLILENWWFAYYLIQILQNSCCHRFKSVFICLWKIKFFVERNSHFLIHKLSDTEQHIIFNKTPAIK